MTCADGLVDTPRPGALVLVVDDSPTQGQRWRQALLAAGFRVQLAVNGLDALEQARRWPPDVIVSDVLMPVMDGFALCRELRRDSHLNRVPLVLHTATYMDARDEEFALALGATRFVLKPNRPEQLLAEIRAVLDAGQVSNPLPTAVDDQSFLQGYSERLAAKLEDKVVELEEAYQQLERQSQDKLRQAQKEIAQHRRAEAILRQSEARKAAILASALDAIITIDHAGSILEFNPAAERTFGQRRDAVVGRDLAATIIPAHLCEQHRQRLLLDLAAGDGSMLNQRMVWTAQRGDGSEFPIEVTIAAMPTAGPRLFTAFMRDISGQKRAEAQIQALNADLERRVVERTIQLEAAVRELDAFSYSISHDLRAPLRAVNGFSRILLADHGAQLTPEAQTLLQGIGGSADRMNVLIDDLLAFSQLGSQPVKKQHVLPADLARGAQAELAFEQEDRSVELVIQDLPPCQADPALLRQVYVNLLANALKFTRKQATAQIEIGSHRTNHQVVYFVKDNGAGFDMRYADRLFGMFQRLHRAEDYEGTGVGLAIVQRIVQRHGGRVWADAAPDQGATFSFTLTEAQDAA